MFARVVVRRLLACLLWLWRWLVTRKPAEVVRAIKAKVASVKATRAKKPPAPAESLVCEAPPVALETATHCPQGAPWCCLVCGNAAIGDTCHVDGSQGKA